MMKAISATVIIVGAMMAAATPATAGPGLVLQGKAFNGLTLNGAKLNDIKWNGIKAHGVAKAVTKAPASVTTAGFSASSIVLPGGERLAACTNCGIKFNGLTLNGARLNDIKWNGIAANGTALRSAAPADGGFSASSIVLPNGEALIVG